MKIFKKLISLATASLVLAGSVASVSAAITNGERPSGITRTISYHYYTRFPGGSMGGPKLQNISYEDGYIMTFDGQCTQNGNPVYMVEYYDMNLNFVGGKVLPAELPEFGAFLSTADAFYVLSGQDNLNENNAAECYRVTRYDKDWNRVSSCNMTGYNPHSPGFSTYNAFQAGSADMAVVGNYLIVHTCGTHYQSSDGLHHQSNCEYAVELSTMRYARMQNCYCSHSFQQYIIPYGDTYVCVDHGDAYPRSIQLSVANNNGWQTYGSSQITPPWNHSEHIDLISFPGAIGQNSTGATLGGVALSSTSILTVGTNSGDPGRNNGDIFVSVTSRSGLSNSVRYLTGDAASGKNYTSPFIVPLGNDTFMVLWNDGGINGTVLNCVKIDCNGNPISAVKVRQDMPLGSDEPVLVGENVVWYTVNRSGETVFHTLNYRTMTAVASPSQVPVATGDETQVRNFVSRLYSVALGRTPDPAGLEEWVNCIRYEGQTGGDVARGFLFSNEFLGRNVSNEDFARTLYRTFFDREADTAGLNGWVNALNGGQSKQEVIEGFINSTEWANLCLNFGIPSGGQARPSVELEPNAQTIGFCTRLYTTCLCREAEQEGLMAWARQLANHRDTGTGAARGFFFSTEFRNANVSDEEYLRRLYHTFMDREPDQAGFDAWLAQLRSGTSREEIFNGFAASIEFGRICESYGIDR